MQNIVELTRAIATELINSGYSKIYLYNSIMEYFFSEEKEIDDNIKHLNEFIGLINLNSKKYKVVWGINGKTYNFFENVVSFSFKKAKGREKAINILYVKHAFLTATRMTKNGDSILDIPEVESLFFV